MEIHVKWCKKSVKLHSAIESRTIKKIKNHSKNARIRLGI